MVMDYRSASSGCAAEEAGGSLSSKLIDVPETARCLAHQNTSDRELGHPCLNLACEIGST